MTQSEFNLSWPCAGAPPLTQAILRATPEDFAVEEQIDIALSGAGEHLWLHVRKRGVNTEFVARALARAAGIAPRAVSYAGMKDRHALTTQWFSLHLPGRAAPDLVSQFSPEIEILETQRHARKLQRGALKGNRFRIVLRECHGDRDALSRRAADVGQRGVPNYFGAQRFGRDGANVVHARDMFRGAPMRDRHRRGIYLSAARSLLFNEVLAQRVRDGSWSAALDGDVFVLNGTNSFFVPATIDATIEQRLHASDIHPSGPLWGRGELPTRGVVRDIEATVGARYPEFTAGLVAAVLDQERRALRLIPADLTLQWLEAHAVELRFNLPAGCYATALLREFADYRDTGGALAASESG